MRAAVTSLPEPLRLCTEVGTDLSFVSAFFMSRAMLLAELAELAELALRLCGRSVVANNAITASASANVGCAG